MILCITIRCILINKKISFVSFHLYSDLPNNFNRSLWIDDPENEPIDQNHWIYDFNKSQTILIDTYYQSSRFLASLEVYTTSHMLKHQKYWKNFIFSSISGFTIQNFNEDFSISEPQNGPLHRNECI